MPARTPVSQARLLWLILEGYFYLALIMGIFCGALALSGVGPVDPAPGGRAAGGGDRRSAGSHHRARHPRAVHRRSRAEGSRRFAGARRHVARRCRRYPQAARRSAACTVCS